MVGLPKSIIKQYGITKKAWRIYRQQKSGKKPAKKGGGKRMAKTTRRKRAYGALFGQMSWKGLLIGTAILTFAKYLSRRFLGMTGAYTDGIAMVGASFVPLSGTKAMRPVGLMELGSEFITDLLLPKGLISLPQGIGGGGYDL